MHIPDGYLGPPTCGALFAAMIPLWIAASRKAAKTLRARQAPLLAIGAAFSFVVMMFNIPIPGGTTGHAVGGVLIAILLGPWAAMIALTVALVIQALLFGDGGITAIGANCFNMAVVLPFAGYGVYRLLGRGAVPGSPRHLFAAGAAGYFGIAAASLAAGVEFGLQPLLHHTVEGQALYCPYDLHVAVPAMLLPHLLVFGWIEGAITALVVRYLQRHDQERLENDPVPLKPIAGCWLALGVLALLSPLGILLPRLFHGGTAWGEWSADELRARIGQAPPGLAKLEGTWKAPLPDYAAPGSEGRAGPPDLPQNTAVVQASRLPDTTAAGTATPRQNDAISGNALARQSVWYAVSAVAGVASAALVAWLLGRWLTREKTRRKPVGADFIGRSIQGTLAFLQEALFADETAARPGLLQSLDPRFKGAGLLLLLLATLFARSLAALGCLYLLGLLLAVLSRLRLGSFLARTWVFVPLFSLAIAIPALFSFVSPGRTALSLGALQITDSGLRAVAFFLGRVAVSVSLAVLLSLTTRHAALLKALRASGVPRIFVMVLGICHRYIYLFVELVEHTYCAIRSRSGARLHHRQGQRVVAWNIGQLWSRSCALNEQVYGAMVSRGFRGEPVPLERFHARPRDWAWLAGVVLLGSALLFLQ